MARRYRLSIENGRVLLDEPQYRPPDGLYRLTRDRAEERRRIRVARRQLQILGRRDRGGNLIL